jgi:hypothetical protein
VKTFLERRSDVPVRLCSSAQASDEVALFALGICPLALNLSSLRALGQGLEAVVDVGKSGLLRLKRLGQALLVWTELLELRREKSGLRVSRSLAVEDQNMRDVVRLDLRGAPETGLSR